MIFQYLISSVNLAERRTLKCFPKMLRLTITPFFIEQRNVLAIPLSLKVLAILHDLNC